MLAASGCPKMPKTPHSSLNLSMRSSGHSSTVPVTSWPRSTLFDPSFFLVISVPLSNPLCDEVFDRRFPDSLRVIYRHIDRDMAIDGTSKTIPTRFTDNPRRHASCGGMLQDYRRVIGHGGQDHARSRFTEERQDPAETTVSQWSLFFRPL